MTVHAEISIAPIAGGRDASMSKEVAAAFDAIRKTRNLKVNLTALGTQVEAIDLDSVLQAVKVAHQAAKSAGGSGKDSDYTSTYTVPFSTVTL